MLVGKQTIYSYKGSLTKLSFLRVITFKAVHGITCKAQVTITWNISAISDFFHTPKKEINHFYSKWLNNSLYESCYKFGSLKNNTYK